VNWLSITYKEFCMNSKKPRKPNFRKDDLLDTLYDTIPNNCSFEQIKYELIEMNKIAKEKYLVKAIKKCEKFNFYLFYETRFQEILLNRLRI